MTGLFHGSSAAYLQQQRVLADPLNWSEKVALQGNVCALLPTEQHTVLTKKKSRENYKQLHLGGHEHEVMLKITAVCLKKKKESELSSESL